MNRDFTVVKYQRLMDALISAGYAFQTFEAYLQSPLDKVVILRHDVDRNPGNSQIFALLEHQRGIRATYYFRIVPSSLHNDKLQEIKNMGHEIGYHYEDMDRAKGNPDSAIVSFEQNLCMLRKLAPINTICMHGSPLSKYDNKDLWKHYDYRSYHIIGEPYFDLNNEKVFYVTDTGRKWNYSGASIRDKVKGPFQVELSNTDSLIDMIISTKTPDQMMITTHPQRWNDDLAPWVIELIGQSIKNLFKRLLVQRQNP